MKAAKENEAVTAEQHARESIRIARTTRELLKKFAAAQLRSAFMQCDIESCAVIMCANYAMVAILVA